MNAYLSCLHLRTSRIVSHFRQQILFLLNRLPLVLYQLAIILLLWIPIKVTPFKSMLAHKETPEFLRGQILVLFPF
jgi:hypothetical protein